MNDIIIKGTKGDFWSLLDQLCEQKICEVVSSDLRSELKEIAAHAQPNMEELLSGIDSFKIRPTVQRIVLLDSDIPENMSVTSAWMYLMLLHQMQKAEIKFDILLSMREFCIRQWLRWLNDSREMVQQTFWQKIFKDNYIAHLKVCVYAETSDGASVVYTYHQITSRALQQFYKTYYPTQNLLMLSKDALLYCLGELNLKVLEEINQAIDLNSKTQIFKHNQITTKLISFLGSSLFSIAPQQIIAGVTLTSAAEPSFSLLAEDEEPAPYAFPVRFSGDSTTQSPKRGDFQPWNMGLDL